MRLGNFSGDDLDVAILGEHAGQGFTKKAVLRGHKDTWLDWIARGAISIRAVPVAGSVRVPVGGRTSVAIASAVSVAIRADVAIATGAGVPVTIRADRCPGTLLDLQTPPRGRAHDGILSESEFLYRWPFL